MKTFSELTKDLQTKISEVRSANAALHLQGISDGASPALWFTSSKALGVQISTERSDALLADVCEALATAAALEFTTIPPYLTALWSIIDQQDVVARSIRAIAHEEMLHLALVNNLITALHGRPSITGTSVPIYPGSLPGGLHSELAITLQGLDDESLETFMEIERPEVIVVIDGVPPPPVQDDELTIGQFYETVRLIVHEVDPTFETSRQIAGPLAPMVLASLSDMDEAIDLIREQGEGAEGIPFETGPDDLAHYYRFKELSLRRRLVWQAGTKTLALGEPIAAAVTYRVHSAPVDGYDATFPDEVRALARSFNIAYSQMLDALDAAWGDGGHSSLLDAIERMFCLRPIAQAMMAFEGPDGKGFTPDFRYVPTTHRD